MTKYILSLDGGGIRGIFTLEILKFLKENNIEFDLIVGTSIGSILGTAYILNIDLDTIFNIDNINKIFPSYRFNYSWWKWLYNSPLYENTKKGELLKEIFYKYESKHINIPVLIPTFNITKNEPKIWNLQTTLIPRYKILDSSSAAPIYFPSIEIDNDLYIDGGVFCNHPSLCGLIEAKKLWKNETIKVLHIGTGFDNNWTKYKNARNWGAINWLENGLLDLLTISPSQFADEQVKLWIGEENYYKIDTIIPHIELDNKTQESINILKDYGQKFINNNKDRIISFLKKYN